MNTYSFSFRSALVNKGVPGSKYRMFKTLIFLSAVALSQASRLTEPHPDCPFDVHHLLPHEYDCTKFYYCENGQKFIEPTDCAPGTEFSFNLQVCVHPFMSGCTLPGHPPIPDPTTTAAPTDAPTNAPTEAPTDAPTEAPTDAPTEETTSTAEPPTPSPTIVPTLTTPTDAPATPTDSPTTHTDAPGTQTDAPATQTDAPATSTDTTDAPTYSTTVEPFPTLPTQSPSEDSSEEDICESKEVEDTRCEEDCHVLPWAHDDCDKYWQCSGIKPSLVVCAEGLHFNPHTHTCDFACNVGCIRNTVQVSAGNDGLKVFLPWNKIDEDTRSLLKLISH